MKNHIYCLYAILWTFIWSFNSTISQYVDEYLIGNKYSIDVTGISAGISIIFWIIPFILLMKKGLKNY
jgi:drug/metabolite transporter (DMT)-like permease